MKDWNVVATVTERGWKEARKFLARFGEVGRSEFRNVLLLHTDSIDEFLAGVGGPFAAEGAAAHGIGHLFPARSTFTFQTPEEFETKARTVVLALAPKLVGKAFHVRMHRRGFKGQVSSRLEEQHLDDALLQALELAATPARISFDDPDAIIDVEMVGNRAGVSLWTREDLSKYAFLKID